MNTVAAAEMRAGIGSAGDSETTMAALGRESAEHAASVSRTTEELEQLTGDLAEASASLSRTAEHLTGLLAGYRVHEPPPAAAPKRAASSGRTPTPAPRRSPRAA